MLLKHINLDITGNKFLPFEKYFFFILDEVASMMVKESGTWWCKKCQFSSNYKARLWEHIEARHLNCPGYVCPMCEKVCPNYAAFKVHKSRYHKK